MAPEVDYIIIGGGLAGSILARLLRRRGHSIRLVDRPDPSSASRVAAGLINPITGKNLVMTPGWELYMAEAEPFYREWETETETSMFFALPIQRYFASEREKAVFASKRTDPAFERQIAPLEPSPAEATWLAPGLQGFTTRGGGCVDTRAVLAAGLGSLRANGNLIAEEIDYSDITIGNGEVRWKDLRAKKIIFCEGWQVSRNPWFSWVPFRHAKGETLTWTDPTFPRASIFNCGKWIVPFPGEVRAGATYEWTDLSGTPTPVGRTEIENGLRSILRKLPQITGHQAGVRPIVKDAAPIVGIHPAHPEIAILNGLGSKGVLWAPRLARQLADALEGGGEIEPTADIRRNL